MREARSPFPSSRTAAELLDIGMGSRGCCVEVKGDTGAEYSGCEGTGSVLEGRACGIYGTGSE